MPTVKEGPAGAIVVSRWRGRYITYQLSDEGFDLLRSRYGATLGSEIGVPTLLELKRLGHLGTRRQRRLQRLARERTLFDPPLPPEPVPPPRPAFTPAPAPTIAPAAPAAPATRACLSCPASVPVTANFCARCGRGVRAPSSTDSPVLAYAWAVGLVILTVMVLVAVNR